MTNKSENNLIFYYIQQVTACCVSLFITGSIFQGFLLESGFNEGSVSMYVSVMQGVQVFAMILFAKRVDRIQNIFRLTANTYFVQILLLLVMIYFSIRHNEPIQQKYIFLFLVSFVVSIYQGIYAILTYKLPYFIIDMHSYGKVSGISGVLIGIAGVIFSGILSYLITQYPYFHIMAIFGGIGIVLITTAGFVTLRKFRIHHVEQQQNDGNKINLFRYKPFYQLLIPNLCRGISNGIFVLVATIGYSQGVLNTSGTGLMVTLSQIATIAGCFLYSLVAGRIKEGKLIFGSSLLFCIMLPFLLFGHDQTIFLLVYVITYFLYVFVNYAIPVLLARNIDYHCIGQYSAWRIALHFGGIAVGNALVSPMLKYFGATGTLIVCGGLLLICGIGYFSFEKTNERGAIL